MEHTHGVSTVTLVLNSLLNLILNIFIKPVPNLGALMWILAPPKKKHVPSIYLQFRHAWGEHCSN